MTSEDPNHHLQISTERQKHRQKVAIKVINNHIILPPPQKKLSVQLKSKTISFFFWGGDPTFTAWPVPSVGSGDPERHVQGWGMVGEVKTKVCSQWNSATNTLKQFFFEMNLGASWVLRIGFCGALLCFFWNLFGHLFPETLDPLWHLRYRKSGRLDFLTDAHPPIWGWELFALWIKTKIKSTNRLPDPRKAWKSVLGHLGG